MKNLQAEAEAALKALAEATIAMNDQIAAARRALGLV